MKGTGGGERESLGSIRRSYLLNNHTNRILGMVSAIMWESIVV